MNVKELLEKNDLTPTEGLKLHIQHIVKSTTGQRVSKEKAWNMYKDLILSTINYALELDEEEKSKTKKLSVAGLFKIAIQRKEPRGKKAGLVPKYETKDGKKVKVLDENGNLVIIKDPNITPWEVVPRISVKLSTSIQDLVDKEYGCPVELKDGQEFPKVGIFSDDFVIKNSSEEQN